MKASTFATLAGLLLVGLPGIGRANDADRVPVAGVRFVDAAPEGPSAEERVLEIRRRIQAVLVYPTRARSDAFEGIALVRFDIEPDGTPRDVVVHRSSGRPSLDRAALRAVAASAPVPWVYGLREVRVRFARGPRQ